MRASIQSRTRSRTPVSIGSIQVSKSRASGWPVRCADCDLLIGSVMAWSPMGPWRSNARIPFCGLQHPETTPPSQKSTTSQTAPDGKRVYFYTRQAVEELRSIPRTQPNYQANIKEDEEWPRIPSPRAQRRADEIVAAWDRYAAAEEEAREQSGYGEIERTMRARIKTLHDLENRI